VRSPDPAVATRAMADLIRHRGPDDRGTFADPAHGLALEHLRLSIIDLSAAGRQPMTNEDGSVVLIFNGEIYNFQDLRPQLEKAGHRFVSRTDSEVIVHGYEEWGEAVVEKLCGMFAFAVWDVGRQTLFLARDPLGIKPLYYWTSPHDGFYFASEVKAFLALPEFKPALHPRTVRQFLELNFITDEFATSLAGIEKLPAGHTLTLAPGRPSRPRRYFSPPPVEPYGGGEAELNERTDRLYETLDRVVREHLIADVPVGLLLSGGLDSSLVAALAARHTRLRTISMGFADSRLDERPFARVVSQYVGSDHEEVLIRPEEIRDDLEASVWFVDDLFGDWGVITTRLLYRKCRDAGVKVILVGEGSDELFGGYPSHALAPEGAVSRLALPRHVLRLYRWFSGRRWGREFWPLLRIFSGLQRETGGDLFAAVRLFEARHQLPHQYIMKVDKASMSVSVEARVPFLDVRVAREGFRTPRSLLLRDGTNKYLLRRVAERHRLLPEVVTRRPKVGGSVAANWMDEVPQFRAYAREVVLDPGGLTRDLGLDRAMRRYFDEGRSGYRFPHPLSILSIVAWRLLLLNLWGRNYLRRQPGPSSDRLVESVSPRLPQVEPC
jgi:asparagine synthase (glutamine-hydrolysing)